VGLGLERSVISFAERLTPDIGGWRRENDSDTRERIREMLRYLDECGGSAQLSRRESPKLLTGPWAVAAISGSLGRLTKCRKRVAGTGRIKLCAGPRGSCDKTISLGSDAT
jgi:hypothetical protein